MLSSHTEYQDIASLTKIINNMEQLEFHADEVNKIVFDILENKEFSHYSSLTDIQALYFAMEGRYKHIP